MGGERTINMPISTESSGMPTTRPKTGSLVWGLRAGGCYFMCVGGGGGGGRRIINIPISTTRPKTGSLVWGLRAGGCYSV